MTPNDFQKDQSGAITGFGLLLLTTTLLLGGLALDYSNAIRVRSQLQVAADSAAHAALVAREWMGEEKARAKAIEVALQAVPVAGNGNAITEDDISFGRWDASTRTFTEEVNAFEAVRVSVERTSGRGNSVSTFLLGLAGIGEWDVRRQSVFQTYVPSCFREGFVAEERVDVTSGNTYHEGFCIHSNSYVEIQNGNLFKSGVIVSMPDRRDIVTPSSSKNTGKTTAPNEGLDAALRDGAYAIDIEARIDEIIAGIENPASPHYRSFINNSVAVTFDPKKDNFDSTVMKSGRIHKATCTKKSDKLTIPNSTVVENVVLITNCVIELGSSVSFQDATIVTTNTDIDSVNAASKITIGKDDGCADGGEAQIISKGGLKFPAAIDMHSGQILAVDNVEFTSNAGSVEGVSIVSGGQIIGTANSSIGFCGGKLMTNNFYPWYFRMAG